MKKFSLLFILLLLVACVFVSCLSQNATPPAPADNNNSNDDIAADVSNTTGSSSESGTDSNTSPAPSRVPEDEDFDAVVDTSAVTPDDNSSSDADTDDIEDPAPVHTHSWTDNGVAVVCPGCGMLDHGHAWDPIYTTELVDDYEMQPHNYCSTCEMDVTDLLASGSSMKQHRQDTGCSGGGYYGEYVRVLVGSHEEQVVIGHRCSICSAEK